MRRKLVAVLIGSGLLAAPATVWAHGELDHPAPSFSADAPLSTAFNSGGEGAEWELVTSFPTGNGHTDLDFFSQGGETFASVGTLAIGPNGGGQTIVQLTENGEVDPSFVAGHPSAACPSNPSAALGLQHDAEAAPKGPGILLNAANPHAVREDTELIVDATDAGGRCHDQGVLGIDDNLMGLDPGLLEVPQGGLEIVDVTDPANPVEIGLTSHIGEAHTVNVDPKRPHIAYAVTADTVTVEKKDGEFRRVNGEPDDSPAERRAAYDSGETLNLDGFEIVDMSSCMGFPEGTSVAEKRLACRPEVYRYRYPSAEIALGHTLQTGPQAVFGCHELEVYPGDRLTCGSGNAAIVFDVSRVFDSNGTPNDFSDDSVRGEPLPCRVRNSSSAGVFATGAKVTDCVVGEDAAGREVDLSVPGWLDIGSPSVESIEHLGSVHHMGRGAGGTITTFGSAEDIDFDHELELTASRRFLLATDERGGGVVPPGATCAPGADNPQGNGGIHAYDVDELDTTLPDSAEEAWDAYARTPGGDKAIYRAQIRTKVEPTVCTAHVFQQIPGQNRIFMGWYSQGTQVVDFVEHDDGTIEFREAGWFTPENANTWVSHVFEKERNEDGSYTYWGATGDFSVGSAGRDAIDVYKVTLPPPPEPAE
jgi:hypothetical protein